MACLHLQPSQHALVLSALNMPWPASVSSLPAPASQPSTPWLDSANASQPSLHGLVSAFACLPLQASQACIGWCQPWPACLCKPTKPALAVSASVLPAPASQPSGWLQPVACLHLQASQHALVCFSLGLPALASKPNMHWFASASGLPALDWGLA